MDLGDCNGKAWVPLFAAVPALLAFILVFLSDGLTWHLINRPDNKITHGAAYHWDPQSSPSPSPSPSLALALTLTITLPLHRHRSPLTAHRRRG